MQSNTHKREEEKKINTLKIISTTLKKVVLKYNNGDYMNSLYERNNNSQFSLLCDFISNIIA